MSSTLKDLNFLSLAVTGIIHLFVLIGDSGVNPQSKQTNKPDKAKIKKFRSFKILDMGEGGETTYS